MSLVLNTNTSGGGAYQLSNSDIGVSYPQLENNCILYIADSIENASTLPVAYSVNGTDVHFLTGTLVAPQDLFFGVATYNFYPGGYYLHNLSSTKIVRIGTKEGISAGLTVGKTIVFPQYIEWNTSAIDDSNSYSNITYKVGLLHTDGTITYITSKTINALTHTSAQGQFPTSGQRITSYPNYGSSQQKRLFGTTNEVVRTNGVLSQEGDYIIAEINLPNDMSFAGYLFMGTTYPYGTMLTVRNKVFQISIE